MTEGPQPDDAPASVEPAPRSTPYLLGDETDLVFVDGQDDDDAMKPGSKSLTSLMGPGDLKTAEQRKKHGAELTDEIVALVQAERKRRGLPPLT